ncbi:MAG: tyrosine-type recombinase/integrase [Candidatus Saccharibacteria bacterium]|nr:tyrosine-type recombinase/integrase [Candidatus Saccharibacteria bacterium]
MSRMTMQTKRCVMEKLISESGCDDLQNFDNKHYDKFLQAEMDRGISARTINTRTAHIVAMVKYFREMGLNVPIRIPLIPKLKELPPRRVFYTSDQVKYVLDNCQTDTEWLLIKIAFDTGMRISEIRNLEVEQINGRRVNFIGKGRKAREVYLGRETIQRLNDYLKQNKIDSGRVWLNYWGYPTSTDSIRKIMRKAFLRCGFEDFYPHALRHSFGSDIQSRGADVMVIKEMMGHSNIATTQKYLHSLDGRLESLFDEYKYRYC